MRENSIALPAKRPTGRRGATMTWVAILLVVFVGVVALAIDWGYAYYTAQKLQNAADAAALAGVKRVWYSHSTARELAIAMAGNNEAGGASVVLNDNPSNDPNGDVIIGHYDEATRAFTATLDRQIANAVAVNARRTTGSANGPLPLIFGGIFGIDQAEITRWGIAVSDGGPTYADLIALNPTDRQTFYIYGHGYLDLGPDGRAQVDSSHSSAALYQGTNITFIFDEVDIVGGHSERGRPDIPE